MTALVERAARFACALVDAGVREVAISPGSRNTPLTAAAIAHPGLRCHAIVDERSAAFFALGQAKVTGRPSVALCTSGSAGAHYLPAMVEAAHAFAPLVVVTADRPPELQDAGAAQTIDQVKLFGGVARGYFDLGGDDGGDDALRAVERKLAQAVLRSTAPTPGPVHVNAPFRKPLEPSPAELARLIAAHEPRERAYPARLAPSLDAIAAVAERIARVERGVIVCGPAPIAQRDAREAVAAVAELTGYPVLAEAASQLRFGCAGALDRLDAIPAEPELIVQLGATPTSAAWQRLAHVPRVVVAPHGFFDPHNRASIVHAEVGDFASALAAVCDAREPGAWTELWRAARDRAWRPWRSELDAEGRVARAVVDALPPGGLLAVGNSGPIRAVDRACPAGTKDLAVWSQRGANGIDGLISGAAGAASVWGRPAALVLGDVSFAHDVGGLAVARRVASPLAIVVIDNRGGRLFEQLPIAQVPLGGAFHDFWITDPELDVAAACAAFGVRCAGLDELPAALERPGATVIRAEARR